MRIIKYIVIHCTAAPQNQTTAEMLAFWKRVNGWKNPGYHKDIHADGLVESLLPFDEIANGVKGFNSNSIHLCCKGGVDAKGNPVDNRTPAQIKSLIIEIKTAKAMFPNAIVLGHRDFSTDQNGNGIIDQWELIKSCPSYDVRRWLKSVDLEDIAKPSGIIYKLNFPVIQDSFVGEIQRGLIRAGYKIGDDDQFGKKTSDALVAFQKKKSLTPSGIADDKTISLLGIR
jgi:N-acetylmuramoyl-L-alanine amidase